MIVERINNGPSAPGLTDDHLGWALTPALTGRATGCRGPPDRGYSVRHVTIGLIPSSIGNGREERSSMELLV
jgi:hypothetical protein